MAVVGLAAMLGALLSLTLPVHLDAANRQGRSLICGSAIRADYDAVVAEDRLNQRLHEHDARLRASGYSGECETWINLKRRAAVLVAAAGATLIASTELLVRELRRRRFRDTSPSVGVAPTRE